MKNSIQHFIENGIPELEKIKLNFMENPAMFDKCVEEAWNVFLQTACCLVCGWLEECNTLLEDSLSHIRIYWKNGEDMLELVQQQKGEETEEGQEEEKYFSASEILSWEKQHSKANGKYIEALQASISSQISGRILFHNAIASVC